LKSVILVVCKDFCEYYILLLHQTGFEGSFTLHEITVTLRYQLVALVGFEVHISGLLNVTKYVNETLRSHDTKLVFLTKAVD